MAIGGLFYYTITILEHTSTVLHFQEIQDIHDDDGEDPRLLEGYKVFQMQV